MSVIELVITANDRIIRINDMVELKIVAEAGISIILFLFCSNMFFIISRLGGTSIYTIGGRTVAVVSHVEVDLNYLLGN